MLQVLKCPECGAPLNPPPGAAATMNCPYCNCCVILAGAQAGQRASGRPNISASDLERLQAELAAGRLIGAIKIYREIYGVDLKSAKDAVERMQAGVTRISPQMAGAARRSGMPAMILGLVISVLAITVGLLPLFRVHMVSTPAAAHSVPTISIPTPMLPDLPTGPAAPPAYANQLLEFGSEGIGAGQFKDARSVAVDGAGHVYVGEYQGGRVQVFDSDGHFLKLWTVDPKTPLMNLAANHDGTVLAIVGGKIRCFEGISGREFGEAASTNGDNQEYYTDACFGLDRNIYALDTDSNVIVLNSDGEIQHTLPVKKNTGDDEASFEKIAVNGNEQIYLTAGRKGIYEFAPDGRYLGRFADSSDTEMTDQSPDVLHATFNIAVDGQGRIFVGDTDPAIKVFSGTGRFLGSYGTFDVCFGIAVNEQDQVYACFRNKYVVKKLECAKK